MKIIIKIIKGILIGFISIIPGISGSLVASSLNIYEEIIDALSDLIKTPFKAIKSVWEYFVGIIIGIGLGVVFVATVFKNFPLQVSSLFIGLIIGGIPSIIKENKKVVKWIHLIPVIISAGIMIFSVSFNPQTGNIPNTGIEHLKYGMIGFIIAAPIIIPGISGAMVLSTMGYYNSTMDLIKEFLKNLVTFNFSHIMDGMLAVIFMGVGAVVGLIIFAKLIKIILNKFPVGFNAVIFGVLIASPISILYALNNDLIEVNSSIKIIANTSNIVVSSFFLIFGFLIANKSSILKYEEIKTAEVTNLLRSTKYMFADSVIIIISYAIPVLVFTFVGHTYNYPELIPSVLTIMLAKIVFYYFLGLYKIINRHIDYKDLFKMFSVIVFTNIIVVGILTLPNMPQFMYRSAFLAIASIEIAGFAIYRIGLKMYQEYKDLKDKTNTGINTLIIGAGRAGELALIEINQNKMLNNNVVGFLDDDLKKLGKTILGKPIIGEVNDLKYMIEKHSIGEVIYAIKDTNNTYKKLLNEISENNNVSIKKINVLADFNYGEIKDVNIVDLLNKENLKIDELDVYRQIKQKNILITGGSGSIGRKLINELFKYKPDSIIVIDRSENSLMNLCIDADALIKEKNINTKVIPIVGNISNESLMDDLFNRYNPNIVIHLAANRNIYLVENNIKEAVRTNILGTKIVCDIASKHKAESTIILSSNESINPINIFGYTKKHTEDIANYYNSLGRTKISVIRIGNVLESDGSVLSIFKKQIERGGPVTVDSKDSKRCFITIDQTVNLILQSLITQVGGEVFMFDMGEPLYILDLAEKLIILHGLRPYVDIDIEVGNVERKILNNKKIDFSNHIKTPSENIYIEKNDLLVNINNNFFEIIEKYETLNNKELIKLLKKGL